MGRNNRSRNYWNNCSNSDNRNNSISCRTASTSLYRANYFGNNCWRRMVDIHQNKETLANYEGYFSIVE